MIDVTKTFSDGENGNSQQQEDIALAAWSLRCGALSERQLLEALRTWTIHGNIPLVEHLCKLGLIERSASAELVAAACAWLQSQSSAEGDKSPTSGQSTIVRTLECVDHSGKIARLMGIRATAGAGAADASARRKSSLDYRIVRKIGQGGLGRVWLAFDEQLNRYVAIKEVSATNNAAAADRFRREAVITGKLEHPGIVPIHQLGIDEESGQAFYAMRFLGKSTLHDAILEYHERKGEGASSPMLIRKLLTDFVGVCQAIGHAHSRKVIHRDLKPENVAIDSFGQVIVIDWGIAKAIGGVEVNEGLSDFEVSADSMHGTMQGQVLGSPLYMAPEQAAGRVDELNEQTDIYGLGAILFAILTGSAPHESLNDKTVTLNGGELLSAITSRPTPIASDIEKEIDPVLSAICAKAMARKQYARYASASDLAADVQCWMAGEQVSAYEETKTQQFARWVRRHQTLSTILFVVVIAGLLLSSMFAVTVRENQIADRELAFASLSDFENELTVRLRSDAVSLVQDARFMSTLPPIQAIVETRGGVQKEGEDESVWRERLETIYTGLLRANTGYLSISYLSVTENQGANIVRVERNASSSDSVRHVPSSRLQALDDSEILEVLATQSYGDVALLIRDATKTGTLSQRRIRLLAVTPVFDQQTGDLFGFVMLETDLLSRVVQFLDQLFQDDADIYVTSIEGAIWLSDEELGGVRVHPVGREMSSVIPELAGDDDTLGLRPKSNSDEGWIAKRIQLDSENPKTAIRVVMQLRNQD